MINYGKESEKKTLYVKSQKRRKKQAGEALVRFGIVDALERHRRGPGQGLDTSSIGVAGAIISPFGQQTRGQALASTRQRTPNLLVRMGQKRGGDGLVVAGNLLDHHQQLFDQRQHQARLGTDHSHSRARDQLGTMQFRDDLGGHARRIGKLAQALVHQARLRLDQGILIARERFQLLHCGAIRFQAAQLARVKTAYLRLQRATAWGQWLLQEVLASASAVAPWVAREGVSRILLIDGTHLTCRGPLERSSK